MMSKMFNQIVEKNAQKKIALEFTYSFMCERDCGEKISNFV